MTTVTLDDTISRQTYNPLTWLLTRQTFWVFIAAIAAFIYLSFATTAFFTPGNLFNVFRNFAFVGIIGLGMTAVIITGGIDLSVGSVLCLAGMVTGMMMAKGGLVTWDIPLLGSVSIPFYSAWIAIPCGIGVALLTGFISGYLIAYLGMAPFVVTLGMMSLARSIAMVMSNNTMVFQFGPDHSTFIGIGGGSTRDWFNALAESGGPGTFTGDLGAWLARNIDIPNPAIVLAILALIFGFAFRWTKWGRYIFAIGGNENAAVLTGVPVRRAKVSVYMLSALTAGIAGMLQVGWLGTITTGMGTGMELVVIAAVVIGGANLAGGSGTAFGAVVGAALIEVIRNSLNMLGINPFWQGTFVGVFIILAVGFDRLKDLGVGVRLRNAVDRLRGVTPAA